MRFLTSSSSHDSDYCISKVLILAALTDTKLEIEYNTNEAVLLDLQPANVPKSMALQVNDDGFITQHLSIMRYLSERSPALQLSGKTEIDLAQIDQWLNLSWQELEVPVQLLIALKQPTNKHDEFHLGLEEGNKITAKAIKDVQAKLYTFDQHLLENTFFVGEKLSIADISLFCAIGAIVKLSIVELSTYTSLHRWFMTIGNHPKIAAIGTTYTTASAATSKWLRHRIRVKELLIHGTNAINKTVTVKGWIRTTRSAEKGQILFVELTDGSTVKSLQLVMNSATTTGMDSIVHCGGAGASLSAEGIVVPSPKGTGIEINVTSTKLLGAVYGGDNGEVGGKNYPMAKKGHSLEFLREKAHLRPRTKVFSSAMRMRNAMAYATHKFFYERGFIYTHTPLITGADCEGAGEQFAVTTLLPDHANISDLPKDKAGKIDFSKDFFGKRTCLTVSGQLNVETHACALSDVYTFGPTFRAENSHTSRHLAEFWMIEPEICFAELIDDMALAEDYVKFCAKYALDNCEDDLDYFENEYPAGEKGLKDRLKNVVDNEFARITYTEAVALLQKEIAEKRISFEKYPNWGDDLGSEHERYITEKIYKKPTIVINYPKEIKAFYMKVNDDNITVAAMDILVPKIGELIGGSQREDRLDVLEKRCVEFGLKPSDIWWYSDLRRYGTVPHAGFGLGFERLIMFVTGIENIRDVIPFPRVPNQAEF